MVTFKQFLAEAAAGKRPQFQPLQVEEAIKILNEHCKDALWMLKENKPFFRGMNGAEAATRNGFATVDTTVDTTATERKSDNTENYYTVILDNNPNCVGFPKRSRSFICSTSSYGASHYGDDSFIIIPFDNVPIGSINRDDMWHTYIRIFGEPPLNIDRINSYFAGMQLKPTLAGLKDFDTKLKSGDKKTRDQFASEFEKAPKFFDNFLEEIWRAYSPKSTRFTLHTTKTLPHKRYEREVWVGGKVMIITHDLWYNMRAAL